MKTWKVILAALVLFLSTTHAAQAQAWLLCDSCSTIADYESVALQAAPAIPNSTYYFAVANTRTGSFHYVEVIYHQRDGDVPASNPANPYALASAQNFSSLNSSDLSFSVGSVEASQEEKAQFAAIVQPSRNEILVAAPPDINGFGSFHPWSATRSTWPLPLGKEKRTKPRVAIRSHRK